MESSLNIPHPDIPSAQISHSIDKQLKEKADRLFQELKSKTDQIRGDILMLSSEEVEHRFSDITCPKETAVMWKNQYLHANSVTLKSPLQSNVPLTHHIGAQAPAESKNAQKIFWGAALENTSIIIDLTQPKDEITPYFPENVAQTGGEKGKRKFDEISVACKSKIELSDTFTVYLYNVKDKNSQKEKLIARIHYSDWKDHEGLNEEGVRNLEKLLELTDALISENSPIMVHCRAGIGRTGTLMVASALKELNKQGGLTYENKEDVIKDLIMQARIQRGPETVQSSSQVATLLQLADKLISQRAGDVSSDIESWRDEIRKHQETLGISILARANLTELTSQVEEQKSLAVIHEITKEIVPKESETIKNLPATIQISPKNPIKSQALLDIAERYAEKGSLGELGTGWINAVLTETARKTFDTYLDDLIDHFIEKKITEEAIAEIVKNLTTFRIKLTQNKQVSGTVQGKYIDINDIKNVDNKTNLGLTDEQWHRLNFVLKLLETQTPGGLLSTIPKDVLDHKGFYIECFNFKTPEETIENAEKTLISCLKLHPGECIYLLRPSTSARGDENLKKFTLSFIIPPEKVMNIRLAYEKSSNTWGGFLSTNTFVPGKENNSLDDLIAISLKTYAKSNNPIPLDDKLKAEINSSM